MLCHHFDAGRCRSCSLLTTPYAVQLTDKTAAARAELAEVVSDAAWLAAFESRADSFRNKAKLVVGGVPGAVTLGILDVHRRGVDLRDCGIHEATLAAALPTIGDFLDDLRLLPYDVVKRRGEVKYAQVTVSPAAELMVRFVLRSERQARHIRAALPQLHQALPALRVATLNFLPEHVALLEGETEEVLTEQVVLPMDLGRLTLHLGPRSFFQTNTAVAQGLYESSRGWLEPLAPASVLDLYCGVGGFGLYAATLPAPPSVVGIEVSEEAVASARHTVDELRSRGQLNGAVEFVTGDATGNVADIRGLLAMADTVVVNPPRRGIGPDLARVIETSGVLTLLYSSCNAASLARDLAALPSLTVTRAQLFDMFPQTTHSEILVLAQRQR